jgi:HPt (histidine-containing phosphotransfer) domain-containing protein
MTESRTRAAPERHIRRTGAQAGRSEKVHHAFLVKLRDHRVRLTILAAGLSRGADTAHNLASIRSLAHEIGGAAAAFEATGVGIAAQALERAAETASGLHANNSDVDVWDALEALRDLLGIVSGERAAS